KTPPGSPPPSGSKRPWALAAEHSVAQHRLFGRIRLGELADPAGAHSRRAPCPSVTSRHGHSPCRWPTSRRVTATAPAKSHAHDPVAGARKGTPITVLA